MIPYTIKSFRGGVSDESDKGIPGSFKYGHGLDIHGRDDVLRCASTSASLGTISGLVRFFVPAADGSTYAFCHNGSIYAVNGAVNDPTTTFVYNDENGDIKGAAEWKLSDGNNYLYWATATSVARAALNGTGDLPWGVGVASIDYKTTLTNTDWHTMKPAGGSLFIANGSDLAEIDYDGNFDIASLNIRPGNLLKCIEERDDSVILGSERGDDSEEGHLWSWITTAIKWIQKRKYPIKGVNALIHTELPLLQGGAQGEIFLSDFTNVVPLATVPGNGETAPGGVSIENDLAVFGIYGGSAVSYPGIWSYGRRGKNRPNALSYPYRISQTVNGSTVTTVGALAVVNGQLLASWGVMDDSYSTYGIDGVSSTTKANAVYESLEFDGGATHLKKMFSSVKLIMKPLPSGTSVSVRFKTDKASTGGDSSAGAGWRYAFTGSGATSFSTTTAVEAIFSIGVPANIYEVGVDLTASGSDTPEIDSIVTYVDDAYDYA